MHSIIIEYDLCGSDNDYEELIEAIKAYGIWARITKSTWFIKTSYTCETVRDKLLKHMDNNDRLFVAKLSGEAAWYSTICSDDYLKKNL